jgi:hypothetical protein
VQEGVAPEVVCADCGELTTECVCADPHDEVMDADA